MKNLALALAVAGAIAAGGVANVNAQSSISFVGSSEQGASPASNVPEAVFFAEGSEQCASPASTVPESAFFIGLGGGYGLAKFTNQEVYAQGVSNVYQNGSLVASGSAAGFGDLDFHAQSSFAPVAQGGYFQHFSGSNWLWGTKFSYSYLGATAADRDLIIPQSGSFTGNSSTSFTGNVFVRSYEVSINHQMTLTPFIGRSFEKTFLYLGGGPTLSQTKTAGKDGIGFADINGTHADITGKPTSFSSSEWVFGGSAVVGMCYFFNHAWFLDFGYTLAMTSTPKSTFSGPFSSFSQGFTDTGTLSGNYSGNVITHSLSISINRAF
jgi:hypothetical protein